MIRGKLKQKNGERSNEWDGFRWDDQGCFLWWSDIWTETWTKLERKSCGYLGTGYSEKEQQGYKPEGRNMLKCLRSKKESSGLEWREKGKWDQTRYGSREQWAALNRALCALVKTLDFTLSEIIYQKVLDRGVMWSDLGVKRFALSSIWRPDCMRPAGSSNIIRKASVMIFHVRSRWFGPGCWQQRWLRYFEG